MPNAGGEPHVQMNRGKDFQVEWVIGHNRHTYLALINKKDQAKLSMHTTALLDDYCNLAPASMRNAPPKKYAKYHRKADMTLNFDVGPKNGVAQPALPNYFQRRVPQTDPFHVARDKLFFGSFRGAARNRIDPKDVYQFEYKAADQATDRWVEYKSDKYPWIISVGRYLHSQHQPSRGDFALVHIPDDAPLGSYILQYIWSGYYDGVDIEVIAPTVNNPYGLEVDPNVPPPPPIYARIDHCWYPKFQKLAGQCRKLTGPNLDPKACVDECNSKPYEQCNGVAVIPIRAGEGVFQGFKDVTEIPFGQPGCAKPANNDPATHMCFPLLSREGNELDFEYWATTDPEDPAFYSTCWSRKKARAGFTPPPSTFDAPDWEYRGQCVSCSDRKKYTDGKLTPVWDLQPQCVNCDAKENGGSGVAPPQRTPAPMGGGQGVKPFVDTTVIYLPFEETSGNQATNAKDTTQKFAVAGQAKFSTGGTVGAGCLELPGNAASFLSLGTFSISGSAITMAAWIRPTNIGGFRTIISKGSGTNNSNYLWALYTNVVNAQTYPHCILKTGTTTMVLRGNAASEVVNNNQWQHVACTYGGSNSRLYLNGKQIDTKAHTGTLTSNNNPVTVGATISAGNRVRSFIGRIDDLRIERRAIFDAEITELFGYKN